MKRNSPGCGCCMKKYNIQKLHSLDGRVIWQRAVPTDEPSETHDLFEIRTCSDGSFVVCDYEQPLSKVDRFTGDRRINSTATSIICNGSNRFDNPDSPGNFNNIYGNQITIKWIGPASDDGDIRDLVWTTDNADFCCNYCTDFTRKWKRTLPSEGTSAFYCSWNDKLLAVQFNTGYTHDLSQTDGSDITKWRTPFADFAGGFLIGHAIQDAGAAGILYMAARAIFVTDWSGNLLFHHNLFGGTVASWQTGCFTSDARYFYMTNNVILAKFRVSDWSIVWTQPVSRFTETGILGMTAGLAYQIKEIPQNNQVVVAGQAFLMPENDNDPQFDDDGFLIDWEWKNVLCYDADGDLMWTKRDDGQLFQDISGMSDTVQRTGLTISTDGHPVVTNYLFTPA